MGIRGLWNLRVNDCWYRLLRLNQRVSPPEAPQTLHIIKQIHEKTIDLQQWEQVPFPSPLAPYFDYVYMVDQDAGVLTLLEWSSVDDIDMPVALEASIGEICENSSLPIESLKQRPSSHISGCEKQDDSQFESLRLEPWNEKANLPTAMIELQQQFFLDFVFLWRFWIDDPIAWRYESRVFNSFSIAILRLASWDFEVSYDCDVPLPVNHSSIPTWKFSADKIYWFHGFLVMLKPNIERPQLFHAAVTQAKAFIDSCSRIPGTVRSIILSPRHVAFTELFQNKIACSDVLPLLTDSSATQCSPGFRILAQVLTSDCWKPSLAHRETWNFSVPLEVLSQIIHTSAPKDAVSFAQASFQAERWYYTSVPQFRDISVGKLDLSITCCGDPTRLELSGVYCSRCGAWQHRKCVRLQTLPFYNKFICSTCLNEDPDVTRLTIGGIYRIAKRTERRCCVIKIGGCAKILNVRLSKPAHLRPELKLIGDRINDIPKGLVNFTIRFNGVFAGLAYGLDDIPPEKN